MGTPVTHLAMEVLLFFWKKDIAHAVMTIVVESDRICAVEVHVNELN